MNIPKRGLAAVILLAVIAIAGVRLAEKKEEDPAYKRVQVERGDLRILVLATGVVEPENRLEIKPPVGGRMDEVLVEEGQAVKRGQVLAWLSSTERAALLDAARAKGPGEVAHWEDLYKPTPVIAPLDGVLIAKNIEPGQTVTVQDAVLVMSDRLTVKASVDETDIGQVRLNQDALITLDAYPEEELKARVEHIAYEATTVNNVTTYEVDVLPDKTEDFLRSGMTANVTFLIEEKKNVLLLPAEAVSRKEGKATVLVPDIRQGKPAQREIEAGTTDGKRVEIISGLRETDAVLVPTMPKQQSASGGNPFMPMRNRQGSGQGSRRGS